MSKKNDVGNYYTEWKSAVFNKVRSFYIFQFLIFSVFKWKTTESDQQNHKRRGEEFQLCYIRRGSDLLDSCTRIQRVFLRINQEYIFTRKYFAFDLPASLWICVSVFWVAVWCYWVCDLYLHMLNLLIKPHETRRWVTTEKWTNEKTKSKLLNLLLSRSLAMQLDRGMRTGRHLVLISYILLRPSSCPKNFGESNIFSLLKYSSIWMADLQNIFSQDITGKSKVAK